MKKLPIVLLVLLVASLIYGCSQQERATQFAIPDNYVPFPGTPSPAITEENTRTHAGDIFEQIRQQVAAVREQGETPVVVYDLDATLFDNRPRTLILIQDGAREIAEQLSEQERAILDSMNTSIVQYSVRKTLQDAGIHNEEVENSIFEYWWERFFTDEYVLLDDPVLGAVEFVNRVADLGVTTVYLTGRDTPKMRAGSLQDLEDHGFPVPNDSTVYLITKPQPEIRDIDYKRDAVEQISGYGTVIACFENEPRNSNLLASSFPDAIHVFLDTAHNPNRVEPLEPCLQVISHYLFPVE